MANEIFARIIFQWDYKSATRIINADDTWRDDALTGSRWNKTLQNVGTSWEAIEIGDLVKTWMMIRNLDTTNFVDWGKSVADATALIRIPAGTSCLFYSIAGAPALRANTAAVDVEILGVEGSS